MILFSILLILIAVFFTIWPKKVGKFTINIVSAPLLILLAFVLIGLTDYTGIVEAMRGIGTLEPWKIIVIFFAMAYITISVDITGLFEWLAYKIVKFSGKSGFKLFIFFYLFASILTIFTSNDIVILTLTPIIYYVGKHTKTNIIHLLFAEFFAANIWSMTLYVGNPTNIIVASALDLNFWEYFKVMISPTFAAGIVNFGLLYLIFRKKIHQKFDLEIEHDVRVSNLLDAVISTIALLLCLVSLAFAPQLGFEIWQLCAIFAVFFIIEDNVFGFYYFRKRLNLMKVTEEKVKDIMKMQGLPQPKKINQFYAATNRMPWILLPFIFCFFVFVNMLVDLGVVDSLAIWLSSFATSLPLTIFVVGILSLIFANLINNQPMTILFASILVNPHFTTEFMHGAAYSLIAGSNIAANLTFMGALAGLMWRKLLKNRGIEVNYLEFLRKGVLITPLVYLVTLGTLYIVLN